MAISLVFLSWLSTLIRVTQVKIGHGYIYGLGHTLSAETLRNALYADYIELKSAHSSLLLKRIEMINIAINSVLTPILLLVVSGVTVIAISVGLFFTDVQVAIIGISGLTCFYVISALIFRKALLQNSVLFNNAQGERIFLMREVVSGFRELKVGALIENYQKRFELVDDRFRKSQVKNIVLGSSPRFVLEGILYTAVALIVYWASLQGNETGVVIISTLATFALGAQRLLPHAQTIYSSASSIIGHHSMIAELCSPLFKERPPLTQVTQSNDPIIFGANEVISISDLEFSLILDFNNNGCKIG
jgi:ABC-type transport system involved in cytochrome bd biosynthesis fused ATPase/permease subunit